MKFRGRLRSVNLMSPDFLGFFLPGPCGSHGYMNEERYEQEMSGRKARARLRQARASEITAFLGCLAAAFSALAALLVLLHH